MSPAAQSVPVAGSVPDEHSTKQVKRHWGCQHQLAGLFGEPPLSQRLQRPQHTFQEVSAANSHCRTGACRGHNQRGKARPRKASWLLHAQQGSSVPSLGWEESLSSSLGEETWIACTQATSTACRGRPGGEGQPHQLPSEGGGTMGGSKTRGAAADGLPLGIPPHSEPHRRPSNAENAVAQPSGPPQPCLLPHRQREASGSQKAALTLSTTTTVSTTSDPCGQHPPLGRRLRQGSSPTASTEAIPQICPQASVAHESGGRLLSARTGRSGGLLFTGPGSSLLQRPRGIRG